MNRDLNPGFSSISPTTDDDDDVIPYVLTLFITDAHITALQFGNMQKLNGPTEDCEDPIPSSLGNCTDEYVRISLLTLAHCISPFPKGQ